MIDIILQQSQKEFINIIVTNQIIKMKNNFGKLMIIMMFLVTSVSYAQEYTNLSVNTEDIPVRELRRFALTGNIGWNSLTGVGVSIHTFATKNIEFDMGLGLASTGFKFGGRINYVILKHEFSPVAGAGILYGLGTGDAEVEIDGDNGKFGYTIGASPYLQLAFGIERVSRNGFFFKLMTGYAILLTDNNYVIKYGSPTSTEMDALDIVLGSGISMEVSLGFAFGNKKQ